MAEISNEALVSMFVALAVNVFKYSKGPVESYLNMRSNSHPFRVLFYLCYSAEKPTMTKLAEAISITKQQLTKIVGQLEEQELVARRHDTVNRRRVHVEITQKGIQAINDYTNDIITHFSPEFDIYDESEKEEIMRSLETLLKMINKNK